MAKRKRKTEVDGQGSADGDAATQNGDMAGSDKLRAAVFQNQGAINAVAQACKNLKRIKDPGPEHIMKFVERVFACSGVDRH